jgi:Zn-dependent M28 family amino/carboxypeptidase
LKSTLAPAALCALLAAACQSGTSGVSRSEATARAERAIRADELLADVTALSSDAFEGRGPGTAGEQRTLEYLTAAFEKAGAVPGNPDGTWFQEVPLVGLEARAHGQFRVGSERMELGFPEDFVAVTRHTQPVVRVGDSAMVFVGYGVVAPEYGWDDFKGVDVRGKTVVMLVNDPPLPDPADATRLDDARFRGRAMTYYGRWTYKYEIASERGAAACVLIHETGPAGYPWEVVTGSWGRENFDVRRADGNAGRVPVEAWISEPTARRFLKGAGFELDVLKTLALSPDFKPVDLRARADFEISVKLRDVTSHNVAAAIPGRGPRADEWIVYSAHWDHLGVDPAQADDGIYNGAVDNATGTAGLVALARAFSALPQPPQRSVLLLAVTAEEQGLLGSKHYAAQPLYPLEKTLCNINMDALNPWGRTLDVVSIGLGQTTLDAHLEAEARLQGRTVVADAEPEKGFYYRSDHFEFAKRGVPALYADAGVQYRDRPEGWGQERRDAYTTADYHKPSDEVSDDWDLSGLVEDLRLFFRVGLRVCAASAWPEWRPGTEFKGAREAMLRAAAP